MAKDYNNVSVRLNRDEYNQLEYLHNKFNRTSFVKVSLADVLRIAVKELYINEIKDDSRVMTIPNREQVLEQLEQVQASQEVSTASEQPVQDVKEVKEDKPKATAKNTTKKNTDKK